jgi:O-acetyl-ADP-ribose deacetylase (regulator of RNase III)
VKPITYLIGDATEPQGRDAKIIAHVCNDVGAWGAGFTKAISRRWSGCEYFYRECFKLGKVQLGVTHFWVANLNIAIANMVAQHGTGWRKGQPALIQYSALDSCLELIGETWKNMRKPPTERPGVHMPRIGCGLGGSTWDRIEPYIERRLCSIDVPVFVYDLPATHSIAQSTTP